jgi:hypothetical protein
MFGKRNTTAAGQAGGAQVSQRRALPAELWQGEMGDLLRQIGMSPDDESNLVPTGASIDARVARDRATLEAKLAEINRDVEKRTGGGRVRPYYLFGDPCWNGELGTFLMVRLQFFPYDDWNVVFLPEDERTAKLMKLPVHPGGPIPGSVEVVEQLVAEAKAKIQAATAEAERTHRFADFEATMNSIKGDVWGLASYLANHIGAASAWKPRG